MAEASLGWAEGKARARAPREVLRATPTAPDTQTGPGVTRNRPNHLVQLRLEVTVPLQSRSIPRQIIYLVLALVALVALLEIFSRWQL